ncbi:MAG: fructose-specific PTS transporter subunit EIIC [Bacillota bacterium]
MRITDLLSRNSVLLQKTANSQSDVIDMMVDAHDKSGNLANKAEYKKAILAREQKGTTAVEDGLAIPHAKSDAVKKPALVALTLTKGVDYKAEDNLPCDLFFMIAAPTGGDTHLIILSRLAMLLMDDSLTKKLRNAKTADEFLKLIDSAENEKFQDEIENINVEKEENKKLILCVTACPTGIAHTYMAAENLEKAGAKLGMTVKVETNGSSGIQNPLSESEIASADGIVVAADTGVETARFAGKRVVFAGVKDGIHKSEELLKKACSNETPIMKGEAVSKTQNASKESIGHQLYKHLMSGVSHMLPFVIGGGILIALAFLFDDATIDPANFGSNTPFAAFLNTVGGAAFSFMLPVLAAYIAYSIADRPGIAVGFVGGYFANLGNSFADISGGISGGFLAALFAGFAGGYIVLGIKKITSYLPKSLDGIKPVLLFPVFGIFAIGGVMFALNPIFASLNTGLVNFLDSMGSTSKILLGVVLGGMMSIDMGGPFNKAAYVTGTASLATANYDIMAAVMVGGMVPPLAIALATTFFKHKFTEEERKAGVVNYVMGFSFITEGAIPFAAKDPLAVLPACIIGSGIAGGLSMFFGCTLQAPHGGIFVFPLVENALGYLAALAVGSAVAMVIYAMLKKAPKNQ